MNSETPRHIPDKSKEAPGEFTGLGRYVEDVSVQVAERLKQKGLFFPQKEFSSRVISKLSVIQNNQNILKNPAVLGNIKQAVLDLGERLCLLDSNKLDNYYSQILLSMDTKMSSKHSNLTSEKKQEWTFSGILDTGIDVILSNQITLVDRAHQRRALKYDYKNYSELHRSLGKIDDILGEGSVVDVLLLAQSKGVDLATNHAIEREGMLYIIRTLNPKGALHLEQMAKNGILQEGYLIPGVTDVVIKGKRIDVVRVLRYFQGNFRNFQSQEREINDIRNASNEQDGGYNLPFDSKNFASMIESTSKEEQGLIESANNLRRPDATLEEYLTVFGKITLSLLDADYFLQAYSGVSNEGRVLRRNERLKEGAIAGLKVALITFLLGKIIAKLASGAWILSKSSYQGIVFSLKRVFGETSKQAASLRQYAPR